MRNNIYICLVLTALVAAASPAQAQVPARIGYEGVLTNAGGELLNTEVTLTFRIYDAETDGSPLFEETHADVAVEDSAFAVQIGAVAALDPDIFPPGQARWLSVQVDDDDELDPRQQFASVPYAFAAQTSEHAADADSVGGMDLSELALLTDVQSTVDNHANSASAHHARYSDAEAEAAALDVCIPSGDVGAMSVAGDAAYTIHSRTDSPTADAAMLVLKTGDSVESEVFTVDAEGDVVARSYAGDGSGLTNVTAAPHTHEGGDITSQVADADTVDGVHAAALEESAEIDADIAAHAGVASAHHSRYADSEAQTAALAVCIAQTDQAALEESAEIDADIVAHAGIASAHHSRYADSEAQTAALAVCIAQTDQAALEESAEIDADIVAHAGIASAHHSRYADSEAQTAALAVCIAQTDQAALEESAEIDADIAAHAGVASAHHSRYADSEAQTAALAVCIAQTDQAALEESAEIDADIAAHAGVASAHHSRYADSEAQTAALAVCIAQTDQAALEESAEIDADIAAHAGVASAHHSRYADSEALAAVNTDIDHGSTAQHDYTTSLAWGAITAKPALLSTLEGVSPDVGSIDLVPGPNVAISGDDGNDEITIGAALTTVHIPATAGTTTSSTSDVLLDSMTVTALTGDYLLMFSASIGTDSKGDPVTTTLYKNATPIADTERTITAGENDATHGVAIQHVATGLVASDTLSIQWRVAAGAIGTSGPRTLTLLRLQ